MTHRTESVATGFRFVDLFAGVGGMRMGFERAGGVCVFTSEWDKYAQKTYAANFQNCSEHVSTGDIRQVPAQDVPDHNILLAGFPCQPFSIAGVSKKNSLGREHGFRDATQGTLFFDVARIVEKKRPQMLLLENVKNLRAHDQGNTFKIIQQTLKNDLGYDISFQVINSCSWVPQNRQRILIVCSNRDYEFSQPFSFEDVQIPACRPVMKNILHPENGSEEPEEPYTQGEKGTVNKKYILSSHMWKYLREYAAKHKKAGNGFGYGLVEQDSVARTLSARYYKDGSEILVDRGSRRRPRRLTPRECCRLMGFPDNFIIPVSDTQAYKQFGNSIVVPMVQAVAQTMVAALPEKSSVRKKMLSRQRNHE